MEQGVPKCCNKNQDPNRVMGGKTCESLTTRFKLEFLERPFTIPKKEHLGE